MSRPRRPLPQPPNLQVTHSTLAAGSHSTSAQTNSSLFDNAHHFTLNHPTFQEIISNISISENFSTVLQTLFGHTIKGAEFDSSERDPPPRCHPGTRCVIVQALRAWRVMEATSERILWLQGAAGVGKSAIMQTVVELESRLHPTVLGATVFLSGLKGRDDPDRLIPTIAYRLAVNSKSYRTYILSRLSEDPTIVNKAMAEQFMHFITTPVGEMQILNGLHLSIYIDGLDELKGENSQCKLVELVRDFSIHFPTAPLRWLIASRPEHHLLKILSRGLNAVDFGWHEVHVPANSPEACQDVERYLREKFMEIKQQHSEIFPPSLQIWPTESQFFQIARSALGHFAFASTAIKFIGGECAYGNPISQLGVILEMTSGIKLSTVPYGSEEYPLAALDLLYMKIMDAVPNAISSATKLLLGSAILRKPDTPLLFVANILNLEQPQVYHALQRLRSVLWIPPPEGAALGKITIYHASFGEFVSDPARSKQHFIDLADVRHTLTQGTVRVLQNLRVTENGLPASHSWPNRLWEFHIYNSAIFYLVQCCWNLEGPAISPHWNQILLDTLEVFSPDRFDNQFPPNLPSYLGKSMLLHFFTWMRFRSPKEIRNKILSTIGTFDKTMFNRIKLDGRLFCGRYFPLKKRKDSIMYHGWASMGTITSFDSKWANYSDSYYLGRLRVDIHEDEPVFPDKWLAEIFGKSFGHPRIVILNGSWAIVEGSHSDGPPEIPLLFLPLKHVAG
ncbi:hypothetical protein D9756_006769 [Leucocoprinus leucothites]|uniref:Nephrocystin 3-like N-terminal domain-containing protein n=1 Tax=Leucocoprinus leucothites TaxID=201217 RepID=A0A8H5LGZ4_9AGAR|nr:hypothetical protein D9756_006769 [Leucoagaricus leucothites]